MLLQTELSVIFGDALEQCLHEGGLVELEGLGVFQERCGKKEFLPSHLPKVFIAYVVEDAQHSAKLYDALAGVGMRPWLDRKKLLPGQEWGRCIDRAIDTCDFFIACFSKTANLKRGQFPYEVRYGLKCADRMPLDDNYFVPVRLEECDIPQRISSSIQHVDLFPDWETGIQQLIESMVKEWQLRLVRRRAQN